MTNLQFRVCLYNLTFSDPRSLFVYFSIFRIHSSCDRAHRCHARCIMYRCSSLLTINCMFSDAETCIINNSGIICDFQTVCLADRLSRRKLLFMRIIGTYRVLRLHFEETISYNPRCRHLFYVAITYPDKST